MRTFYLTILFFLTLFYSKGQTFIRAELSTTVAAPWEIIYGPDDYLWLSEFGGRIARVDPVTGNRTVIHLASDYYAGSSLEQNPLCFKPNIRAGTFGMALHPDFTNPATAFIYYIHSYNHGTELAPDTRFKIKRLTWDSGTESIIGETTIVDGFISGYDHTGGRLMIIEQAGTPYLFFAYGDVGISEDNQPACYNPQSTNPNNFAQDISTTNGKIHRFNLDGSIPADNPIPGNSMYTRGHRNPQGLMYNSDLDIIYSIEHGDRTDDEINILQKGMNYGWKEVRGYHGDDNHPGETDYINNYVPEPSIAGDQLVEAFYSWCPESASGSSDNSTWCTVAPSGGIYYNSTGIPEWTNSLLVVTLKKVTGIQRSLHVFKLDGSGNLIPSTAENPNPQQFFGDDEDLNGRLRDVAVSPDGKTIYLINNGGTTSHKITTYTLDESPVPVELDKFTGKWDPENRQIILNWTTLSETDNDRFEVMRSTNGESWETIGIVKGKGNSSELVKYQFRDNPEEAEGQVYYRLKQVDYDGEFEYSPVLLVLLPAESVKDMTIYPNPLTAESRLKFFALEEGEIQNLVYSTNGQLIRGSIHKVKEGKNELNLSEYQSLPSGEYIFMIYSKSDRKQIRVVR